VHSDHIAGEAPGPRRRAGVASRCPAAGFIPSVRARMINPHFLSGVEASNHLPLTLRSSVIRIVS
jgi:hypothetical protein